MPMRRLGLIAALIAVLMGSQVLVADAIASLSQRQDINRPAVPSTQPSPPPRLAEPPSYLWLVLMPLIPLLGGGLSYLKRQTVALSARGWDRLVIVIITYLPLIGLALVSVTAFVAYGWLRGHLKQPTLQGLERMIDRKSQTLDSWFTQQHQAIQTLVTASPVRSNAVALLQSNRANPSITQNFEDYLRDFKGFGTSRPTLLLLDPQGTVIFATDSRWQGRHRPEVTASASPHLSISPLTARPQMTLTAPIVNNGGESVGMLAVDLDLRDLYRRIQQPLPDHLIFDQAWNLEPETYLVGQSPQLNQVILPGHPSGSAEASTHRQPLTTVSSWAVEQVLAGVDGSGLYLNHNNTPVIGIFRWVEQYNLALVAEISQSQVFQPARQLTVGILGVGLVLTGGVSVGLYPLKRRLQRRLAMAGRQASPSSIRSSSPQ